MIEEKQQDKYFPLLAGVSEGGYFSQENVAIWKKKKALPQKAQDILMSDDIAEFIYGVEQRFHLLDAQTEEFAQLVRKYFFREVTEQIFAKNVAKICKTSPDNALKLLRSINAIEPGRAEKEAQMKNVVQMPLQKALIEYPHILSQTLTEKPIISKPFLKPLKPTVKNWIMVYEKVLDVSKHNALERGEFLFRAEATRNISEKEEQRLSQVFKSRDEDSVLFIDTEKGEIVFPDLVQKPQKKNPRTVVQKPPQHTKTVQPPAEKTRKKSFDVITPIMHTAQEGVAAVETPNQKETESQKGIFGTETYLVQKNQEKKGETKKEEQADVAASTVNDAPRATEKKEKVVDKEEVLQSVAGEITQFTQNITKRPEVPKAAEETPVFAQNPPVEISVEEQEDIDREIGKKKRTIGVLQQKKKNAAEKKTVATTSGKAVIAEEEYNIATQIAKEQEELTRATQRMEAVIAQMQENVEVPRSIGQKVEKKDRVSMHKEHGNLSDTITQNRKDLYGSSYVHDEDDIQEQKEVQEEKSRSTEEKEDEKEDEQPKTQHAGTIVFHDGTKDVYDNQVQGGEKKQEHRMSEMTFSSNHTLPAEQDRGKELRHFGITPIGHTHVLKKEEAAEDV